MRWGSVRLGELGRLRSDAEGLCEFSLNIIDRKLLTQLLQAWAVAQIAGFHTQQDTKNTQPCGRFVDRVKRGEEPVSHQPADDPSDERRHTVSLKERRHYPLDQLMRLPGKDLERIGDCTQATAKAGVPAASDLTPCFWPDNQHRTTGGAVAPVLDTNIDRCV